MTSTPSHIKPTEPTLKSILLSKKHTASKHRKYHEQYLITKYGDSKKLREIIIIKHFEKAGMFTISPYFMFVAIILYVSTSKEGMLEANSYNLRCEVPVLEKTNFTFEQISMISNFHGLHFKQMYYTCNYFDRNYSWLLQEYKYDYKKIMRSFRKEKHPPILKCNRLIRNNKLAANPVTLDPNNYFSLWDDLKLHCSAAVWIKKMKISRRVGILISSFTIGYLSDLYGRLFIFTVYFFIGIFGGFLVCYPNIYIMCFGRFLLGLSYNDWSLLYIMLIESTGFKQRKYLGYFLFLFYPMMNFMDWIKMKFFRHWQFQCLLHPYYHLTFGLIIIFTFNESPRWLLMSDNEPVLWEIFEEKLFSFNYFKDLLKKNSLKNHFDHIRKPRYKSRFILIFLYYCLAKLLYIFCHSTTTEIYYSFTSFSYIIALIFMFILMHYLGKRNSLLTFNFIYLAIDSVIFIKRDEFGKYFNYVVLIQESFCFAMTMTLYVYTGEVFSTTHRGTAFSFCLGAQALSSLLYYVTYGYLNVINFSYYHFPYFSCAIFCVLLLFFLPDSNPKELPDRPIEALFISK